jgi:hypothetical protein
VNLTKFAVCDVYKNGDVFPVEINIQSEGQAISLRRWMQTGQGQFDDWRLIPMGELKQLLIAGKVRLEVFTAEAQAAKRAVIMGESETE